MEAGVDECAWAIAVLGCLMFESYHFVDVQQRRSVRFWDKGLRVGTEAGKRGALVCCNIALD